MPRSTRLIIPNVCHHALQRGNNRQDIFLEKGDRFYYLKWAGQLSVQYQVPIMGYCLMTNHVHLLVLPRSEWAMINFMKLLGQRYTQYFNRKYRRSGKLWENRYKLHPVDPAGYYVVLKYIEMNPVRAGLVSDASAYAWSSARYHLLGQADKLITADYLHTSAFTYREFFYKEERPEDLQTIRLATQQGRAWGGTEFLEDLARICNRVVTPRRRGRPKKENK